MAQNRVPSLKEMALSVYLSDKSLEDIVLKALIDQGLYSMKPQLEAAKSPSRNIFAAVLEKKTSEVMPVFMQAMIDDDIPTITALLDHYPWLLLQEAPKGLMIESKLTWQRFDVEGENALSITAKLKKICMLDKLQPYIKKLDQTDLAKAANALSQWSTYEIHQVDGRDEIVIPQHITDCAQYLIDQLIVEPFPNMLPNGNPDILHLSDKSEFAINCLFDQLLCPKTAVKLDNHIDIELLLLAVYKAYVDNFSRFQNLEQRDAFCIRVIGLIQSVLTPETAKMFCESIHNVAESIGPNRAITEVLISDLAMQHKLKGGESFYHSSRGSQRGVGYEFLCGVFGLRAVAGGAVGRLAMRDGLKKLYRAKTDTFWKITQQLQSQPNQQHHHASSEQSRCVIL